MKDKQRDRKEDRGKARRKRNKINQLRTPEQVERRREGEGGEAVKGHWGGGGGGKEPGCLCVCVFAELFPCDLLNSVTSCNCQNL